MIHDISATDRRMNERRVMHGGAELASSSYRPFVVHIVDISATGVRVVAPINPRPGDMFRLRMRLPLRPSGSLDVETNVRVVHSVLTGGEDGFILGLAFLDLPDAAGDAIRDYVRA